MNGRIVKYIGDEVMVFFEGQDATLNARQVSERVLVFCKNFDKYQFEVKISLDYGSVSMIDFSRSSTSTTQTRKMSSGDPNGRIVDRCARIMSKASARTVLCSKDFRDASPTKGEWRKAGTFTAKGIGRVEVYQLKTDMSPAIKVVDEKMSLPDCLQRLEVLQEQLVETKALIHPHPRSPR